MKSIYGVFTAWLILFFITPLWAFDFQKIPSGLTVPKTTGAGTVNFNPCLVKNSNAGEAAQFQGDLYCCKDPSPRADCLRERIETLASHLRLLEELSNRIRANLDAEMGPSTPSMACRIVLLEGSGAGGGVTPVDGLENVLEGCVNAFNSAFQEILDMTKAH